jgi:hypothetical protein
LHFHELVGELGLLTGLLLGAALTLLVLSGVKSASDATRRSGGEEEGEHPSRPIPLILKILYSVILLWAAGYTLWVIFSGVAI